MASLEGGIFVVFYYVGASETDLKRRVVIGEGGLIKGELLVKNSIVLFVI
jgi:hypothetical protein